MSPQLVTLCRPLLDTIHFLDNSSDTPRLIFEDEAGGLGTLLPASLDRVFKGEL